MNLRDCIKDKKRIVIKVGSSSLQHKETGGLDYIKLEVLVREICNLRNMGKEVVLVSQSVKGPFILERMMIRSQSSRPVRQSDRQD